MTVNRQPVIAHVPLEHLYQSHMCLTCTCALILHDKLASWCAHGWVGGCVCFRMQGRHCLSACPTCHSKASKHLLQQDQSARWQHSFSHQRIDLSLIDTHQQSCSPLSPLMH